MMKIQIVILDIKKLMAIFYKVTMDSTVQHMMKYIKAHSMTQQLSGVIKLNMSNGQSIQKHYWTNLIQICLNGSQMVRLISQRMQSTDTLMPVEEMNPLCINIVFILE